MPEATVSRDLLVRKFPPEIIANVCRFLDEGDRKALASVCKGLQAEAELALYNGAAKDPVRGKHALLWAADTGNHGVLKRMLSLGVDPNGLYYSFITKPRLDDVFAAQGGRHGAVGPSMDENLEEEIEREVACRDFQRTRRDRISAFYYEDYIQRHYGPLEDGSYSTEEALNFWRWGPIHLAVYRGDKKAVCILLEHDALATQPCSGLCDCLTPTRDDHTPRYYRGPGRKHSVWTPLHLSICQGHQAITDQLLCHLENQGIPSGVALKAGGESINLGRNTLDVTAFHTAAITGSVNTVLALLNYPSCVKIVNSTGAFGLSALHMAALSGHIESAVFELLCTHPKKFKFGDSVNNPLRDLCERRLIGEATRVFELLQRLRVSGRFKAKIDFSAIYNSALVVLCQLSDDETPRTFRGHDSLRETEERVAGHITMHQTSEQMAKLIKPMGLELAKKLLGAGADANFAHSPEGNTVLKSAVSAGFSGMVELLLENMDRDSPQLEQPLLCAISLSNEEDINDGQQLSIIRALLNHGVLTELTEDEIGDMYVDIAGCQYAVTIWEELEKHFPVCRLEDEKVLEMLDRVHLVHCYGDEADEFSYWILRRYIPRFSDSNSDAQALLAERLDEWTQDHDHLMQSFDLLGRISKFLIANTTITLRDQS